jgi:hypothetical protein
MTHTRIVAIITDALCQAASEPMALIKSPQRQQTGITGDLTTRKISSNDSVENAGFAKTQRHQSFRAPFLFFASKIVNNPG